MEILGAEFFGENGKKIGKQSAPEPVLPNATQLSPVSY
jgi:hypothetical protein